MTISVAAKQRAWKLVEGYSDVGLAATKDEVADLLEWDPSDVDSALANLGMERCGSCGIWHAQADCSIEHPEFPMNFYRPVLCGSSWLRGKVRENARHQ